MSASLGLLKKIIDEKCSISVLKENGITRDFFNLEDRPAFDFICDYYKNNGQIPLIETVTHETGVTFPTTPDNALGYWIDKVKENHVYKIIVEWINNNSKNKNKLRKNGNDLVSELYNKVNSTSIASKTLKFKDGVDVVIEDHDKKQRSGHMLGVPFGIPYLDSITDGAQPADTIALCARPGIGKTMFLLTTALAADRFGANGLYVTLEMSALQNIRRMLAIDTSVPLTKLRLGRLSMWARKRVVEGIDELKKRESSLYFLEGSLKTTVEDLVSWVHDIKPSILYVDGAYLLRSSLRITSRIERIAYTAETLKSIAMNFKIPVIATYQYNRQVRGKSTGSLDKIGWSDTIPQLASIVLGLADFDEDERETFSLRKYKILEILKGREGEKGAIKMLYDMNRMYVKQDSVLYGEKVII